MTSNQNMNNTKETINRSQNSSEPRDSSENEAPVQQNGALGAIMENYTHVDSDNSNSPSQSSETSQVNAAEARNDADTVIATLESSSSSVSSITTDPAETATSVNFTEYRVNADDSSDLEPDDSEADLETDVNDKNAGAAKKDTAKKCEGAESLLGCSSQEPPIPDFSELELEPGLEFVHAGYYYSCADTIVTVESVSGVGPFDSYTPLFLDALGTPFGFIYDVMGPVHSPFYVLRFNSSEEILKFSLEKRHKLYAAPKSAHTKYVFLPDILRHKGSDASWIGDREVPQELEEYSDDEKEFLAKHGKPTPNSGKRGCDDVAPKSQQEPVEGPSTAPSFENAESKTNQFQKRGSVTNGNNNNNYRRKPETKRSSRNVQFRERQNNPPRIQHNPPAFSYSNNDLVAVYNPSIPPPMHLQHSGNVFIPHPQQPHGFSSNYQNYMPLPPVEFRSPPPQNFSWQPIHNGPMQYPPQAPMLRPSFYPHVPAATISNAVGPFRPPQFAQNPPSPGPGPATAYITVPQHSISPGPRFGPMPHAGLSQGYICSVPAVNPSTVNMPAMPNMVPHVQHIPIQLPPQVMEAPNCNLGATSGRYR